MDDLDIKFKLKNINCKTKCGKKINEFLGVPEGINADLVLWANVFIENFRGCYNKLFELQMKLETPVGPKWHVKTYAKSP